MAVRGSAVYITLPCILLSLLPLTIFFIMVAYPGHILESTIPRFQRFSCFLKAGQCIAFIYSLM